MRNLSKDDSIELNPDEKLTKDGISGRIAKVGVGFGTGRHSEQRSAVKIRNRSHFEDPNAKRKGFVFKKTTANCLIQTDDPPCSDELDPQPYFKPIERYLDFKLLPEPKFNRMPPVPEEVNLIPNFDWSETKMYKNLEARAQNKQPDPENDLNPKNLRLITQLECEYWAGLLKVDVLKNF